MTWEDYYRGQIAEKKAELAKTDPAAATARSGIACRISLLCILCVSFEYETISAFGPYALENRLGDSALMGTHLYHCLYPLTQRNRTPPQAAFPRL